MRTWRSSSTSPAVSWGSLPYILRTFRCFSLIKTWWPATRGVFKWSIYKVFYQGWRHFLSFGLRRGTRPAKPIYCLDWNLYEIYVGNNYCYYVSGLGQCYDTTPRYTTLQHIGQFCGVEGFLSDWYTKCFTRADAVVTKVGVSHHGRPRVGRSHLVKKIALHQGSPRRDKGFRTKADLAWGGDPLEI